MQARRLAAKTRRPEKSDSADESMRNGKFESDQMVLGENNGHEALYKISDLGIRYTCTKAVKVNDTH
jgi:hypothetical protein